MKNILTGSFSKEMMIDWKNNDENLLKWREETGLTNFENDKIVSDVLLIGGRPRKRHPHKVTYRLNSNSPRRLLNNDTGGLNKQPLESGQRLNKFLVQCNFMCKTM